MAKLTPVLLKDENPIYDGTFNVKIRIGHKSLNAYLETNLFVGKSDIRKDKKIKTDWVIENASNILKKYNAVLLSRKHELDDLSAADIKRLLIESDKPRVVVSSIDFIKAVNTLIVKLESEGKSVKTFKTVLNDLVDYTGGSFDVGLITSKWLKLFDDFLRSKREIVRVNQGKGRSYTVEGLGDGGVHNRMRDLRSLFNKVKEMYNDEEVGKILIPNNPFKKYKLPDTPETEDRDITVEKIKAIRDLEVLTRGEIATYKAELKEAGIEDERKYVLLGSRDELTRDLFMLSFYLCGMNGVDMLRLTDEIAPRVDYQRKKTENKRKDKAFISIKIINEATPIYKKYAGTLSKRYKNNDSLNKALNFGIKRIGKLIGEEELDFYSARYSFGSLARNKCRISVDDIARAMNHKDNRNSTTDIYISKDWSVIDDVQRQVADLLIDPTV